VVNGADVGLLLLQWGPNLEPAAVTTVTPSAGPWYGGTQVTLTGVGLCGVDRVTFADKDATSFVAVDDSTVVATAPPGSIGTVSITIFRNGLETIVSHPFEYLSPVPWAEILSIEPDPNVVTNAEFRNAIVASGLPWRVQDNATQIEMLLVPPGTFLMGCSGAGCDTDEHPIHSVSLTQAFYLGRYEVTAAQWVAIMGGTSTSSVPITYKSPNQIASFLSATGLRLPTEAEWEYACRGGTTSAYNNGSNSATMLGDLAWFYDNSQAVAKPVGQKTANAIGFHDMHGNAFELCSDWYDSDYYGYSPSVDPPGAAYSPDNRWKVMRGGSFYSPANECRSSRRRFLLPDDAFSELGFRVARTP
jgi:formylglycine-generating enzyme required for sulfatase activity